MFKTTDIKTNKKTRSDHPGQLDPIRSTLKRKNDYDQISLAEKIMSKRVRNEAVEIGFPNLGNSCYINAILRCLIKINNFFNYPVKPTKIFENSSIEK